MAQGNEIARAFVTIVPSMKDAQKVLTKELGGIGSFIGNTISRGITTAISGATKIIGATFAAATTAVLAFGKSSIEAGAEFDKSMAQVAATLQYTTAEINDSTSDVSKEFNQLRDFAIKMGETTVYTAVEASEALNFMALAGYNAQESMEMLPNALNLAAAGSIDLATASSMVVDTQKAFGITFDRTTQLIDEMAKAASTGNTTVEQMGDAFLRIGALARDLNGGYITLSDGTLAAVDGFQELEIALVALANAGIKGTVAGTRMRNMLLKLSSPTAAGTKALEKYNIAVFDTEGKMRSLRDIMGDLGTTLSSLTEQEQFDLMDKLFNVRDVAAAKSLINAIQDADWDEIGESILAADGAAKQMAETKLDNLAGDIQLFNDALASAKIAISDELTPSLRNFVQYGTELVKGFTEVIKGEEGLEGIPTYVEGVISSIIQRITPKIPNIFELAASLIDGLINGLYENEDTISDAIDKIFKTISKSIKKNSPKISSLMRKFIPKIPEVIKLALSLIEEFANALVDNSDVIGDAIVQILEDLVGFVERMIPKIPIVLGKLLPKLIPAIIQLAVDLLLALVDELPNLIPILIGGILILIGELINHLPEILLALYKVIYVLLDQIIVPILEWLYKLIYILAVGAWEGVKLIGEYIWEGIKWLGETIWGAIETFWETIGIIVIGYALWLYDNVIAPIGKWFKDLWDKIAKFFKNLWEDIKRIWKNVPTWFDEKVITPVSKFFENLWKGIKKVALSAARFLLMNVAQPIALAFATAWDSIKYGAEVIWWALKKGFAFVVNTIIDIINGMIDGINWALGWTGVNIEHLEGITVEAFDTIANKSTESADAVKDAFGGMDQWFEEQLADPIEESFESATKNSKKSISEILKGPKELKSTWETTMSEIKKLTGGKMATPTIDKPHLSITPKGWKLSDILTKGTIPKINIEWYAKAMDKGIILDSATIFGALGNKLLGGGETGSEAVVGTSSLMQMITHAVDHASNNFIDRFTTKPSVIKNYNGNPITINVYGAEGQKVEEIAEIVMDKIQEKYTEQEVAYA